MEHPNLRPATSPACWIGGTWVSRPPQTHPPWEHQQIWGGTVEHLVGSSGPSSPVTGHQSGPEWLAAFHRGAPCWRLEPGSDGGGWCWKLEVANLRDFGVHFGKCLGSAAFFLRPVPLFVLLVAGRPPWQEFSCGFFEMVPPFHRLSSLQPTSLSQHPAQQLPTKTCTTTSVSRGNPSVCCHTYQMNSWISWSTLCTLKPGVSWLRSYIAITAFRF